MNEQEILDLCCDELGLERARITDKDGFRWTIAYDNPWFSIQMLKLEKLLHEKTTRPIDLRSETAHDKNRRVERTGR